MAVEYFSWGVAGAPVNACAKDAPEARAANADRTITIDKWERDPRRVQAHSYVDDSRYLCNHQQLANLGSTVAIFDVLQKTMCRHWLDAAIVPRPFILP